MTMHLPLIGKVRQPAPWLIGLIAAGLLGGTGVTLWAVRNQAQAPDISQMTVPVESDSLQVRITANGTIQPIQTVNLSPKSAGLVAELFVEQGDRVTQGQVIARMENQSIAAQLTQSRARVAQAQARLDELRAGSRPQEITQAEARVQQAEAQVRQAETQLDLAEQKVTRNRSLASQGAISQDQFDEFLNQAESARADLAQAQAQLGERQENLRLVQQGNRVEEIAQAQAQLDEAIGNLEGVQVQEEDTYIRAPFDGVITQKYANAGAFVTPTTSASDATSATSTAIVAVAQGLEVLAEVPEVDIKQLRIGQPVEIVADSFPDQVFQGNIRLIAPEAVVRQNVTSFQVRVALTTGQNQLRSGMNADVTFLGNELKNAIVVPTVAIVTQDGETGVLVPNQDQQPQFRVVKLGAAVGNQTQILEGLESGERVFTDIPPDSEWANEQRQQQAES